MGVLAGLRIIEIAGIGPAPFCGMLLADMGADVIVIERGPESPTKQFMSMGKNNIVNRGKRSLRLNLKDPKAIEAVHRLLPTAHGLIEGMRPGVMERLGLGPEACHHVNPSLVYGRLTGWGQHGPLAQAAGHDINYIALSGALWFSGHPGTVPTAPPTLVGDLGGGALYLALGMLGAILHVKNGGAGQVIDAAIVDGSANLMNLLLSAHAAGLQPFARGSGLLDGPHWYGSYVCADDACISIGALEPQFNSLLFTKLGLNDDPDFQSPYDVTQWGRLRTRLTALFLQQPRAHWVALLEGTDACFAPVLNPAEAMLHPHMAARQIYSHRDGVLQAAPAPRFANTPSLGGVIPECGEHGQEILCSIGMSPAEIECLLN